MFKCKNTNSWSLSIDIPSKQLKVEYEELHNWMTMVQALVAKAKIDAIQNEAFYSRDEPANQIYFHTKDIDRKYVRFYFDTCVFDHQLIRSFSCSYLNYLLLLSMNFSQSILHEVFFVPIFIFFLRRKLNALNVNINKKELYASSTNKWDHNVFKVSFSAKKNNSFD
ncbi:hypothetical protein RFI_13445 [Reticulomyxa filosa]|uniref:Uncharacterized protein n=1 Tax=Reticulomyxa filosa TaxID=46433 RepID=X6ND85_RETFI|nr:hypothetical protein RFI_13445 [Reticulomyxa filosa]|eukprot:ETO23734.1 hypothetical protein RFI_13445 [Reticulomyxa filosa]